MWLRKERSELPDYVAFLLSIGQRFGHANSFVQLWTNSRVYGLRREKPRRQYLGDGSRGTGVAQPEDTPLLTTAVQHEGGKWQRPCNQRV